MRWRYYFHFADEDSLSSLECPKITSLVTDRHGILIQISLVPSISTFLELMVESLGTQEYLLIVGALILIFGDFAFLKLIYL